jgi:teichuronic acid biosynthesis glycosyltransferase TuaC
MRILMLIHRLTDNSPYCFYVHDQAMALRALGHDVVVVSPVGRLPFQKGLRPDAYAVAAGTPREAVVDGVPVYYPRYPALGNAGERLIGGAAMARCAWGLVRRLHAQKPFDVIHAHMLPLEGHAGEWLARRLKIPCVITVHGTDVIRNFPAPGEEKKVLARHVRVARAADALMAVSSLLQKRVAPYRGAPVDVVPNGVDLSLVQGGIPKKPRSVLSVATLKKRKCVLETLEAFIAVAGDYPDATMTFVGVGELESALRARIHESGLEARAILTGGVTHAEVMRRMEQSDVLCVPSYAEGYGIVYIEAMACGAVAIGARGEGIEDMIRDGENGFLVPAGDVRAIEGTLRRIFEARDGLEMLRARARADARALTWEENARRVSAVYARVVKKKKESVRA